MDPYTIAEGAGGLWEVHQWNGGTELNTQDDLQDRIFVERILGLHKRPEWEDPRSKKVGRIGENAYPSSPGGKTVNYVGELTHSSLTALRVARTAMVAAFAVRSGHMDIIPDAGVEGQPTARFYAEVLDLDPPEEIIGKGFKRNFQLDLRMSDPRFYYPSLAVDETGNPAAVTNPGDAPADPVITVAGASGDVAITDGTRTLAFAGAPSGALVIDFANRSAKVGATRVQNVPSLSDWWDAEVDGIAGGATVSISQTGGTGVQVQFTPATWG